MLFANQTNGGPEVPPRLPSLQLPQHSNGGLREPFTRRNEALTQPHRERVLAPAAAKEEILTFFLKTASQAGEMRPFLVPPPPPAQWAIDRG